MDVEDRVRGRVRGLAPRTHVAGALARAPRHRARAVDLRLPQGSDPPRAMFAVGCTAAAAARPAVLRAASAVTSRTGPARAAAVGAALAAPLRSVRAYAASDDASDASLAPGGGAAFWDKMEALAGDKKSTETAVFAMG